MATGSTMFLTLVLFFASVASYRNMADMHKLEDAKEKMMLSGSYCASSRCSGSTDKENSTKKQLMFRYPFKVTPDVGPMDRAAVATERKFPEYHHGSLKDCEPVTGMFSYSNEDWAIHMQINMRDEIWPNQPGKDNEYLCAEKCKLKIFNEKGLQLNKGSEPEVWVEREGHPGDMFSAIPVLGWSPAQCIVGNALQAHWWKQKYERGNQVMADPKGLPVYPSHGDSSALVAHRRYEEFAAKFCALTPDQKISVVKRVTSYRPNPRKFGTYYGQTLFELKARNYFPSHFPRQCDDGWKASEAEGVVTDN